MESLKVRRSDKPPSQYRHASPPGPWPWMDFRSVNPTITKGDAHIPESWQGYPQSKFGNWTPDQVKRSQMLMNSAKNRSSIMYWMDVLDDGKFAPLKVGNGSGVCKVDSEPSDQDRFWEELQQDPPNEVRVRLLFVDDLTKPVLQMLGTKYDIEPSFFTSSIDWIPSRYQKALIHGEGDQITITLPFVRTRRPSTSSNQHNQGTSQRLQRSSPALPPTGNRVNAQGPILLQHGELFVDLLAIHMVRNVKSSTFISYHPGSDCPSADHLRGLMLLVGESVYWQKIFSKCKDPTLLFLAILWYAIYAWNESLELLYEHISSLLEDVLSGSLIEYIHEFRILQDQLLRYELLLHEFDVSVSFIEKTPNPAMKSTNFYDEHHIASQEIVHMECQHLLSEVERLQNRRGMMSRQLENEIGLALADANIRDSIIMKQAAYMSVVFLPASLIAGIFGMNVKEINTGSLQTLAHYITATIVFTVITVYIVITFQTHSAFHRKNAKLWMRATWPVLLLLVMWKRILEERNRDKQRRELMTTDDNV